MELNHHDESSEEGDHSENIGRGLISRWYECIFCKRGFNTAQALGGHMNIHRKERTRNNKPSSNTHKRQTHNNLSGSRLYPQVQVNYAGPSSHGNNYYHHHHQECFSDDHLQPSDPLIRGGDWRVRVSLGFDPTVMEELERNRQVIDQKEELDLELRLGCNS